MPVVQGTSHACPCSPASITLDYTILIYFTIKHLIRHSAPEQPTESRSLCLPVLPRNQSGGKEIVPALMTSRNAEEVPGCPYNKIAQYNWVANHFDYKMACLALMFKTKRHLGGKNQREREGEIPYEIHFPQVQNTTQSCKIYPYTRASYMGRGQN